MDRRVPARKPVPVSNHHHVAQSDDEEGQSLEKAHAVLYVSRKPYQLRQIFWRWWEVIHEPTKLYNSHIKYPVIDSLGRTLEAPLKDCYLSPSTGQLRELVVQASDELYESVNDTTWARRECHNTSPLCLRLCSMPYKGDPSPIMFAGKWVLACVFLMFALTRPIREAQIRWQGRYAPFPYVYHGYPKTAKNAFENATRSFELTKSEQDLRLNAQMRTERVVLQSRVTRLFRPLKLNIEKSAEELGPSPRFPRFRTRKTSEWREENYTDTDPEYLLISYTRDQFRTEEDYRALYQIAEQATLNAGLKAYWLDNCLDREDTADVYRINDYIRQSAGIVIVRGYSSEEVEVSFDPDALNKLLRGWGRRVWTFPEVLLSPAHRPIKVYTKDLMEEEPNGVTIPKTQFAEIVWDDAEYSGELVNHFEGSLSLSRIQLAAVGFQCLRSKSLQRGNDPHMHQGDRVYALAGLMKERPSADTSDSELQAFARLSLANDSDQLLERLICVQPKFPGQPWQEMQDAWNIPLWDILPTCQISAVGHDDTFIIDGARGAAVRWKGFRTVAEVHAFSWKRWLARIPINITPYGSLTALSILIGGAAAKDSLGGGSNPLLIIGAIWIVSGVLLVLSYPWLVPKLYSGKAWGHQAWLFGIEGHEDIKEIEARIWNEHTGRLTWSPFSSPLSRHRPVTVTSESQECETVTHCEGVDPYTQHDVREQIKFAESQGYRVFTLVDTLSMTVTLFLARRPPVAFLVCGQEGGMQRAVGVSYDHTTETVHRETVLRMDTQVLNGMDRVSRCRIGLDRHESGKWATQNAVPYQPV